MKLTRRDVLRLVGAGAASAYLPGCRTLETPSSATPAGPLPTFFTAEERLQLAALADYVVPPDAAPGGSALGAVPYIENLLTCLETPFPQMFLGGPFSGRQPYPTSTGYASTNFPEAEFTTYRPPSRFQLKAWQLNILGSSGVPGGGPNDAVAGVGPVIGLQAQLRTGLAAAAAMAPKPLEQLTYDELNTLWPALDPTFTALLQSLVPQGVWGAPEYGGNPGGAGWAMVRYEGDILPLGFSYTDPTTGLSVDNPVWPTSVAQPGPDPQPMSEDTINFLAEVVSALGGTDFTS